MLNDKIYQMIFDELVDFLPVGWENLIVYLEHGEDSYSYSFYVKTKEKYVKCFYLDGLNEEKLFSSFSKIEKAVSQERANSNEELWSNMTMSISSSGSMKTDFNYTDLSMGNYQYKKDWKKKYLD